ncbi:Hypothetical protein PP7435_CHR4-0534 [Komagataella phaffii CBS 7435]|uniref:Uncharacterized protein n=2 Tax=Komagataella phaffii TaxID=460519 RepID=C4R7X4_KOMPG|nr:Hypothetical protein PAS_chr4_0446 [Komagataella phaffii GS115]AOA64549.1 GQ67_04806T0 [Komagataella phaffii]CAH2450913.1 Hypothetical protein BQ9382_C4-2795 [Komagataella phaffii CBS 7435]AOA69708.1 GQ68_04778T0 [Komagataella phaffii GS115]CAY71699.1 Hypothetical protein PAS_chr4_0446 [Komagataella phaffii GS115]CCA40698.1 Hypothetical protein PP7435_CHR4-0534 [Komagataella phaffii CBS 7435]
MSGRAKYQRANVYDAVDGKYTKRKYEKHDPGEPDTIAPDDPWKDDVKTVRVRTAAPPDEVLAENVKFQVPIPIKDRDSFAPSSQLPDSDLLKALHYYTAHVVSTKKPIELLNMENDVYETLKLIRNQRLETGWNNLQQSMDCTALLSLGALIEGWVEEFIDGNAFKMYMERKEEKKKKKKRKSAKESPKETHKKVTENELVDEIIDSNSDIEEVNDI